MPEIAYFLIFIGKNEENIRFLEIVVSRI